MHSVCRSFILNAALAGISCALLACQHAEPVQAVREPIINQSDQNFIAETQQLATRDRAMGALVKGKSANAEIKQYADIVMKDDSSALQQLDTVVEKYKLRTPLSPAGEQLKDGAKLKSVPRKALDRQFVDLMLQDDRHAIAMLQEEKESQSDLALRQYASDLLPGFQSELKQAEDLEAKVSPASARKISSAKGKRGQISHSPF